MLSGRQVVAAGGSSAKLGYPFLGVVPFLRAFSSSARMIAENFRVWLLDSGVAKPALRVAGMPRRTARKAALNAALLSAKSGAIRSRPIFPFLISVIAIL